MNAEERKEKEKAQRRIEIHEANEQIRADIAEGKIKVSGTTIKGQKEFLREISY